MHNNISNAKKILLEISLLQDQLSQLATPTLSDVKKLPEIHQFITNQPNIDRREVRHYFVVVSVYLYSPLSLFGKFPIRTGLCQEVGEAMGSCRQEVSEMFSQAKFRYENIPSFREQVETIFEQVLK